MLKFPHYYEHSTCLTILILETIENLEQSNKSYVIHTNSFKITKEMQSNKPRSTITNTIEQEITQSKGKFLLCYSLINSECLKTTIQQAKSACNVTLDSQQHSLTKDDFLKIVKIKIHSL